MDLSNATAPGPDYGRELRPARPVEVTTTMRRSLDFLANPSVEFEIRVYYSDGLTRVARTVVSEEQAGEAQWGNRVWNDLRRELGINGSREAES